MTAKPEIVARIHHELCVAANCKRIAELNYFDPCGACPEGHFGPYILCRSEHTHLPVDPNVPLQLSLSERPHVPGPGTILMSMLAMLGIRPVAGCQCKARARMMDVNGGAWCLGHIAEIVGWLKEEAKRARLPFFAPAAELMVRRAIRKARALQSP